MSNAPRDRLPNSWECVPLEDPCLIIQGQSPPGETYNTDGNGFPFFQGKAEFGTIYPTPVKWCTAPTKIARPDDVLISIRAPVGPTNLSPAEACIGRGLAAIRPRGGTLPRYVLYALRNSESELASKGTGSTFAAIGGMELRRHRIPLAPVAEQYRIVAEIEKHFTRLDAAVAALHRARANLKRYRAAVLKAACEGRLVPTEAALARAEGRDYQPADVLLARIQRERQDTSPGTTVGAHGCAPRPPRGRAAAKYNPVRTDDLPELPEGWTWTSFGALLTYLRNGISLKPDAESGTPILRISAVRPLRVDMDDVRYLRGSPAEFAEYALNSGDLLFTRYNGSRDLVGVCAVVRAIPRPGIVHPDKLIRAKVDDRLSLPSFLAIVINSGVSREFIERRARTTAGQTGISGGDLGGVPIPLPPRPEQERIAAEVERRLSVVDEQERQIAASLKRAERLRQAILKRAFDGRLVPQDPSDEPASVLLERIRAEREQGEKPRPRGAPRHRRDAATAQQPSLFDAVRG